jgi:hypothetical protein
MITICLRYGHIICGSGARILDIRAVCGGTVDIFRRILPGIRHFGRGLLPRRSHIGGDCFCGNKSFCTSIKQIPLFILKPQSTYTPRFCQAVKKKGA